ncbi:unnamed protein product [Danaus chrysippus]|uniref:Metalloendopeptidase n=1 Tax=Danaus chrysippus TaxID=151541 RepID=A0A8J2QBT6_9NEOP|nr:unnamed protein product [Danaus chrysippus]
MSVLESSACIRFKAAKDKPNGNDTWLHITNPKKKRECVHEPEILENGEIVLVLGYDCLKSRDLIHSLLHGIGLKDEVTHPHRDNYVKIVWENIQPAYRHLYRTQPVENSRGIVEYDPLSIMHFHDRAFSINGKATILPLETGLRISPSEGLSQLDKMKLHIYFGHECNKRKFVSLMETCKMSLKSKKDSASDEKREKRKDKDNVTGEKGDDNNENDENEGKNVTKEANKLEKGETGEEPEEEAENLNGEENNSNNEDQQDENDVQQDENEDQQDENATGKNLHGNETKLAENDDVEETKNTEEDNTPRMKNAHTDNENTDDSKEKTEKRYVPAVIGVIATANSDASSGNVNQLTESDSATEKKMNSGINLNYDNYTD